MIVYPHTYQANDTAIHTTSNDYETVTALDTARPGSWAYRPGSLDKRDTQRDIRITSFISKVESNGIPQYQLSGTEMLHETRNGASLIARFQFAE